VVQKGACNMKEWEIGYFFPKKKNKTSFLLQSFRNLIWSPATLLSDGCRGQSYRG
jgi:hypothetical protein